MSLIQEVATAAGEEDVLSTYGTESTVSLATGYAVPIRELPAAATVMTRRDIEQLGIRTLAQALDTIPGVQVVSGRGRIRLLNIRGIFADLGPDVLIKRDNIPLTQGIFNSLNPLDLIPITNIERIEVIRGPNSATDGADALAGCINIVTRTSAGFRGTELGARAGDHDTYDVWLNHGAKIGPFAVALGLSAWTNDGPNRLLETDVQSQLDRLFGVRTSLAPGILDFANHGTDMQLDVTSGPWHLRAGYYAVYSHLGAGIVQVIDPEAKADTHYASTSLTYEDTLTENLQVSGLFSFIDRQEFFKEAFTRPRGVPGFPDGILGDLENDARLFRGEAAILWSGWPYHKVRIAAGAYSTEIYNLKQHANARSIIRPDGSAVTIPIGRFRALTDDEEAFPENSQRTYFSALLDEWSFANDWTLTTGLRFDGFSAIGVNVTPRVSLVWNATQNTTLKLLYGRGFRPPTYLERLSRPNQGVVVGNPDLDPQKLDNLEFGLIRWGRNYRLGVNLYGYRLTDQITVINPPGAPLMFSNNGDETGYGFELDGAYAFSDALSLRAHYAYHDTTGQITNAIGAAPKHLLYLEANWEFLPRAFFDLNVRSVFDRARATRDPRPPVDDYVTVNVSLRKEDIHGMDLVFTLRNIFDEDARDPSSDNGLSSIVPLADTPLPGREFWGEIRVRL